MTVTQTSPPDPLAHWWRRFGTIDGVIVDEMEWAPGGYPYKLRMSINDRTLWLTRGDRTLLFVVRVVGDAVGPIRGARRATTHVSDLPRELRKDRRENRATLTWNVHDASDGACVLVRGAASGRWTVLRTLIAHAQVDPNPIMWVDDPLASRYSNSVFRSWACARAAAITGLTLTSDP